MKQIPNIIVAVALAASAAAQDQVIPIPSRPLPAPETATPVPPQPIFTSSRQAVEVVRQQIDQLQSDDQRAVKVAQELPRFAETRLPQQELELAYAERAVQLAQSENGAPRTPAPPAGVAQARPVRPGQPQATATTLAPMAGGFGHRGGAGALVIRSGDVEAKEQESLEQDLPVMARLLSKSLPESGAHSGYRAMGIDVTFAPGNSPIRSMYIEGYGALFMLNVGFPLLPPPNKTEPQKEKPAEDSAWEQAKHEVYGRPAQPRVLTQTQAGEPYDEGKVNQLKDGLLEALKNATNIRGLKSEDTITVCVFGGGPSRSIHTRYVNATPEPPGSDTAPEAPVASQNIWIANGPMSGGGHASLLTIRVKKSDVESFAKGKMNLDEFRHKARSSISLSSAGGDSGASSGYTIFGSGGGNFGTFGESWGGNAPLEVPKEP